MLGIGATSLKSNFTRLSRPYKLNFAITFWCQSHCVHCVKPDEVILGDNTAIANLGIGNHAIGSSGLNKISQVFSRPYKGKLIRIKASGLLPIEITPEHPLFVLRSETMRQHKRLIDKSRYSRTYEFKGPEWKQAKDIIPKTAVKDGDYMCMPMLEGKLDVKTLKLEGFNRGRGIAISRAKGVPLSFPLNVDTAWLLGIYTAEGCPASNGARFSFNTNEVNLHAQVKRIAKLLGYSVTITRRGNSTECCLSSHVLSRAFAEWCGKGAAHKKIPDFILLNRDRAILEAFLKGWEEGDGYWNGNNFYGSTVSKTLALQLQLGYASLGLFSRLTYVQKGPGKFYDKIVNYHSYYMIAYQKAQNQRYSKRMGKYFLLPIRSIEEVSYTGTVHNIETQDNTYLVSNAIVHNCNIWDIKPKGELSLEEIREFAKKNNYFKWVQLTGGEPFLRSDIVEIAKAFAESSKGLYMLTMPTNSLCNLEMEIRKITEMLELKIPRVAITISLDGYREMHDAIRGVPGNFDKAMDMYGRLKELKKTYPSLFFVFGYTMIKQNQGAFQKTYESVKQHFPEIKYNDFHINLGQISENYYHTTDDGIKISDRELVAREITDLVRKREFEVSAIQSIEQIFLTKLAEYARTGKQPMKSRGLDASLFLDSWGNVYPSIMWNKKVGNIREIDYDLSKIWHGKEAEEIRREIREGREPPQWTSCEAYQTIMGDITSFVRAKTI